MFILFKKSLVRCFSCEKVSLSKINELHQFIFLCLVVFGWAAFALELPLVLSLSRYWARTGGVGHGIQGWGWLVLAAMSLWLFLDKAAHSCGECGSVYITRADR